MIDPITNKVNLAEMQPISDKNIIQTAAPIQMNQPLNSNIVKTSKSEDGLVAFQEADANQNVNNTGDTTSAQAAIAASNTNPVSGTTETVGADGRRYVTQDAQGTDAQQATINGLIDKAISSSYNISGLELVDDVTYQNSNGVPTQRVVTKQNGNGEKVTITIDYDEQGRVKTIKSKINKISTSGTSVGTMGTDGEIISFRYEGNGDILIGRGDGYDSDDGLTQRRYGPAFPIQKISPNGKMYRQATPIDEGSINGWVPTTMIF